MNDFFNTVRSFLLDYLPNQKCFSKNTIKAHKDTINLFVSYLRNEKQMKVEKITFETLSRESVLDFLKWLEKSRSCSPSTQNQRLSILRTFFEYAGQIDCTQVALELSIKKIPNKKHPKTIVEFLSEDALKALLNQPDVSRLNGLRDRFFMTLMYDTAARCSELLTLKVSDLKIYATHPVAYLKGKGDKIRSVPLMPKTVEHCKLYLKEFHPNIGSSADVFLFYTTTHGVKHRLSAAAALAFVKRYGKLARVTCPEVPENVHPHQLRHTRAIHLYRKGMPLVLVGEYLGHVSPETTKIYAYADTEMKRAAMEKVDGGNDARINPIWRDDEDMILKLSGLK